jgi:hypothetical protein
LGTRPRQEIFVMALSRGANKPRAVLWPIKLKRFPKPRGSSLESAAFLKRSSPSLVSPSRVVRHPGGVAWPKLQLQHPPQPRGSSVKVVTFMIPSGDPSPLANWISLVCSPEVSRQIGTLPLWQVVAAQVARIFICFELARVITRFSERTAGLASEVLLRHRSVNPNNSTPVERRLVNSGCLHTLR